MLKLIKKKKKILNHLKSELKAKKNVQAPLKTNDFEL